MVAFEPVFWYNQTRKITIIAKHIKKQWDKLITRLLAFLLRGLLKSGDLLVWLFGFLSAVLRPLAQVIFKFIILPSYGRHLWLKSQLAKNASQRTDKFLLLLTNRYLYHVLLVLLGVGVVTSNLLAYENKEDYGQNALVYKLAGVSDIEIIEDSNNIFEDAKVYNYQDQGLYVQGNFYSDSQGVDQDNIFTDQAVVQGDLALIKPVVSTDDAKNTVGVIQEYEVVQGDSIGKIAARFGVSVNTVLWANNLSFSSYVKPGQKLIVPSMSGIVYKVVKGDTISKIAKKYGIAEAKIIEANALSEEGLTIGKLVIVPGAKIIETAKPRAVAKAAAAVPARTAEDSEIKVQGTGRMSWPNGCYRISQYYKGWIHTGLDIACPWGTPLRAADSGTVIRVQYGRTGYGYNVIIDHGGGITTLYGHMSRIDVAVGQSVEKGEVIGAEGSTGRSTGPHLHFEVRINGARVNPLGYIR
ncbi:MAG: M23 family metallopeptidase [Candidatus Buchananbacteria bacterium]